MAAVENPVLVAAVLCVCVLASELLCTRTVFRHLGTALMVIVVTALLANLGAIPTANSPVYDGVFAYVAPLCIFWLLLQVNLRSILRAGVQMLGLFLVGAAGTVLGVVAGMWLAGGAEAFGDAYRHLGGMFVGTYVGGSINFNALAMAYRVNEDGVLYTGAMAVDSILTTVWMVATIVIPKGLGALWPRRQVVAEALDASGPDPEEGASDEPAADDDDGAYVTPVELSLLLAAGLVTVWGSELLAESSGVPAILILTTVALLLAQLPGVHRLGGARLLGMFAVYLFLAVIGAYCDVGAVGRLGELGGSLLVFVSAVVAVHGVVVYGFGAAVRADVELVSVASQANIGGGTSALALARSLGRPDLVLPAILVGALGNGLGTYLGFATAAYVL